MSECVPSSEPADVDRDLVVLLEAMEATDWKAVPGISCHEAAAWTARVDEARDKLDDRSDL